MKNFLTRLLTSVLILAIFGVMVIASFHRYVFELTVSLISMMCIYEAVNAIGFSKCKRFSCTEPYLRFSCSVLLSACRAYK